MSVKMMFKNKAVITDAWKFGKTLADEINNLKSDKVSPYKFGKSAFNVGESLYTFYQTLKNVKITDRNWEVLSTSPAFKDIIENVLKSNYLENILYFKDETSGYFNAATNSAYFKFENVELLWRGAGDAAHGWIYIKPGTKNEFKSFFRSLIWSSDSNRKVYVAGDLSSGERSYFVDEKDDFITSPQVDVISDKIKKYWSSSYSTSIILYGPPGTGKSNIARGISKTLGLKTLRMNIVDLYNNGSSLDIKSVIDFLDPDLIIFEDIDYGYNDQVGEVLSKFESFSNEKKLIIATTNHISKLSDAFLRPGRFDEIIEVKTLDEKVVRKLVNNDEDIFEIVKDYPVAFINELVKRVNVFGKEEALNNLEDLKKRFERINNNEYDF